MTNWKVPKHYAGIIEKALAGETITLDKVDLTARKILQRFARESGSIRVHTQLVVEPIPTVRKPRKKVNKKSVHFILAWDWVIITTGYILAYTLLF